MKNATQKAIFIASVIIVIVGITVSGNYVYNRWIKK
jgi:hypothetical protein